MHYRLLFSPPGQGPEIIPRHQKLEPLGHQKNEKRPAWGAFFTPVKSE